MKVASLFSGIGGLDRGLELAGHEIILQCEIDPSAQQVLRRQFPGVLLVPDVCGLASLPKGTELVAAGFPCIDVSRAGLRAGLDGAATGLVRHVFRLLKDAADDGRAVPWVLLENVEALLDRAHGDEPPVAWVCGALERLGYRSWAHRVVSSAGFGVPNRRRRVFVVASMHGDARDVLLAQGVTRCLGTCLAAAGGDCWECFNADDGDGGDVTPAAAEAAAMARCSYALDLGNARSPAGVDVVPTFTTSNARICLLLPSGRYGALTIEDAERLQGFPEGWTGPAWPVAAPGVRMHARGGAGAAREGDVDAAQRVRFALLGNAVTVSVAAWLGERLTAPYAHKHLTGDNDVPLPRTFQPPDLPDSLWDELDELRTDATHGTGAASGQGHLQVGGAMSNDVERGEMESQKLQAAPRRRERHATGVRANGGPWPRAAWYLAGRGRWGLRAASTSPVKSRFTPLGEFVTRVGPPPPDVALVTYLQRLKEQGWDVSRTARKMAMCGVGGACVAEGQAAPALAGLLAVQQPGAAAAQATAPSIGRLVWAALPSGGAGGTAGSDSVWWPAEAIDPFRPPAGFQLRAEHKLALTPAQRAHYLPAEEGGGKEGSDGDNTAAGPRRLLLLLWFHRGAAAEWRNQDELLPFEHFRAAKRDEGRKLIAAGRVLRPAEWQAAYREAKHCWAIQRFAAVATDEPNCARADNGDSSDDEAAAAAAALADRAARQAAAVNAAMPRCRACETCCAAAGTGARRRCLLVRASAAAAAGHAGAQLAVLGQRAVGAELRVWWPLDAAWYHGVVTSYDPLRVRHAVEYDDGDMELLPLWAPQQRIELATPPSAWADKAAEVAAEAAAAVELRREAAARVVAGKPALDAGVPVCALTPFEEARAANMARNTVALASIMGREGASAREDAAETVPDKREKRDVQVADISGGNSAPATKKRSGAATAPDAWGAAAASARAVAPPAWDSSAWVARRQAAAVAGALISEQAAFDRAAQRERAAEAARRRRSVAAAAKS